jgi:hypothetical protein
VIRRSPTAARDRLNDACLGTDRGGTDAVILVDTNPNESVVIRRENVVALEFNI